MSYSVIYSTHTDNAAKLSGAIVAAVGPEGLLYDGKLMEAPDFAKDADLLFVGFWTTANNCDQSVKDFLQGLHHKKIAFFGSCGFGDEASGHFDIVKNNVLKNLDDSTNTVLGFYLVNGRIGYQYLARGRADNWDPKKDFHYPSFKKFYKADEGHPTVAELKAAGEWAKGIVAKAE